MRGYRRLSAYTKVQGRRFGVELEWRVKPLGGQLRLLTPKRTRVIGR